MSFIYASPGLHARARKSVWKQRGLLLDPSKVSDVKLHAALKKKYEYSDREAKIAANQIGKFVGLKMGDMVLLCGATLQCRRRMFTFTA